jgi:peptidoglycan-associated lipoprotein
MKHPIPASVAVAAALALLAGCETTPSAVKPTAVAPSTTAPAATAPATRAVPAAGTTGVVTPQSQVATVDLSRQPATGAGASVRAGAAPATATPTTAAATAAAAPAAATAALVAPSQRIVYFDFDSFVIKDDYNALLDGHAKVLARSAGKRVVIEGHTDERGGREYNLALGQKRAEAVAHSLQLLGVSDKQLEAVSFGEERPAVQGSDESAWSRNRRAELKDR